MVTKEEEKKQVERRQDDSKRDKMRRETSPKTRQTSTSNSCVSFLEVHPSVSVKLDCCGPVQTDPSCFWAFFLSFFPTPVLFFFLILFSVFEVFLECVWTAHGLFLMCVSGQLLTRFPPASQHS